MTTLLEDLEEHLRTPALYEAPNLTFRVHTFSDADLQGTSPVLLLRRSGTGGDDDDIAQSIDVDVTILVPVNQVKLGENLCHALRGFLKSEAGSCGRGVFGYVVFSHIVGPVQLTNGKHRFMFMIRCFTENQ